MNLETLNKEELIMALRRYCPCLSQKPIASIRLQYLESDAVELTECVRIGEHALESNPLTDKRRYTVQLAVDVYNDELDGVKAEIERLTTQYFAG